MKNHPLHERALRVSRQHHQSESEMIEILIEAQDIELHKIFERSSLFVYVTDLLNFSKSVTYAFLAVAKKAVEIPALRNAIHENNISVSLANRIVPHLTLDNSEEFIDFAITHTRREVEDRISKLESQSPIIKKTVKISAENLQKIKRVREIHPSNIDAETALGLALDEYLRRHDPVEKAKKAKERSEKRQERPSGNQTKKRRQQQSQEAPSSESHTFGARKKRKPLTAAQKHSVILRDDGCCTFRHQDGTRCTNRKWLESHHIIRVSRGGQNDMENLTTLCAYHHDLVHQLSFPLDNQVNWIQPPKGH